MICKKCGQENPDGIRACIRCGEELNSAENDIEMVNVTDNYENQNLRKEGKAKVIFPVHKKEESKFTTGFFCGLIFSLISFLGVFAYSSATTERSTYAKGCFWGFIAQDIVATIISLAIYL